MFELDIPQSPSAFAQSCALYRCRTFPGLKDLLQETDGEQSDSEVQKGSWESLKGDEVVQQMEGSKDEEEDQDGCLPSPGLLMSSPGSWEGSWRGSNDIGMGMEEGETETQVSSPGILISAEDPRRNTRDQITEEINKCWVEDKNKNKHTHCSTLNNESEGEHDSGVDSDEETEEELSLHCYILPSGSKSSFYFVKRSLETIPEEDESPETAEAQSRHTSEEGGQLTMNGGSEDHINLSILEQSEETRCNGRSEEKQTTQERTINNNLLEELSNQDFNDIYCVLSDISQHRLCKKNFNTSSPSMCKTCQSRFDPLGHSRCVSGGNTARSMSNQGTNTERSLSSTVDSPPLHGLANFRPKLNNCAKVHPADNEKNTYVKAWVYQHELKTIETIKYKQENTIMKDSKSSSSHKKSSTKTGRKHKKHTRGYSFLHSIWKSFRRKMFVLETF